MFSELSLYNILPYFGQKYTKKRWHRNPGLFWRVFGRNMGQLTLSELNFETIFGIPPWRDPLRPAIWKSDYFFHLLPLLFSFFRSFVRTKKQFYGRKVTLFCYSHPMARKKPQKPEKRWVRCKMKRANGQVRSCKVIRIWKYLYNTQPVIQKLLTKLHVNRANSPE